MKQLNLRKNVSFAIGELAIGAVLLFLSYRLLIRVGGLQAVGVWATLYAWINVIRLGDAGVASAGLRFLAMYDLAHEREQMRRYGETALLTNVAQFAVLTLLAYASLRLFGRWMIGPEHIAAANAVMPLMLIGFFMLNIAGTVQGLLQGLHLGFRRSQIAVGGTVLQLAAVLVLVPRLGLKGMALAQIVQQGAILLTSWTLVRRRLGSGWLPWRFDRGAFGAMLNFSLKAQVVNITNGALEPLAKLMVGHFGGMSAQGLFELALKSVTVPRNVVASGVNAALPAMTNLWRDDRPALGALYARSNHNARRAMLATCGALLLASPVISWIWLSRIDLGFIGYLAVLVVAYAVNGWAMAAYNIGMASGQLRYNIIATLLAIGTVAVLGPVLGLVFGGLGAAVSMGLALACSGIAALVGNHALMVRSGAVPPVMTGEA